MKPEWMAKITAPNPETLVDRLNGIYPSAIGTYKASPLEKEAANEIVRLRDERNELINALVSIRDDESLHYLYYRNAQTVRAIANKYGQ